MRLSPALRAILSNLPPEARALLRGLLGQPATTAPDRDQPGEVGGGKGDGEGGGKGDQGGSAPPHRYRLRTHYLVGDSRLNEVLSLFEQLNAVARGRGFAESSLWVPTFGRENELIVELELDTLAAIEINRAQRNADPRWTALVRKIGAAVVPGSVRTELIETAAHLTK